MDAWRDLYTDVQLLAQKYASELGPNAYAILNTVTDLASRPPDNRWVRRESHSLQRLAGKWLAEFTEERKRKPFDLAAYVRRLAPALVAA